MPRGGSKDYEVVIPVKIRDSTSAGSRETKSSVDKMIREQLRAIEQAQRQQVASAKRVANEIAQVEANQARREIATRKAAEQASISAQESLQRQRSSALTKIWNNEQREFARVQQNHIKEVTAAAQKQTDVMNQSWSNINKAATYALAGLAAAIGAVIIDTTLFAGRTNELTIALHQMAKANHISNDEVDKQLRGLLKLNIARQEATQILAQVIGANLDFTKTTQLARIAQDTAVISGKNSSEAFQDLANAILLGTTRSFRAAGVFISVKQALDEGAKALGTNRQALTEHQRQQILVNAVIEYGARLTGTYEAAMGSASKQMRSLVRVVNDTRQSFGDLFQGAFMVAVTVTRELLLVLGKYPAVFLGAATAVGIFTAAIIVTTTAAIPSMINNVMALVRAVILVGQVMVGQASLIQGAAATMTVWTLGWAAVVVAIGAVIIALTNEKSAAEKANEITLESIDSQTKALQTANQLVEGTQKLSGSQTLLAADYELLENLLGRLDPATRAYIESLNSQEKQIAALNDEIERNRDLQKTQLEATLRVTAGGVLQQIQDITAATERIHGIEAEINRQQEMLARSPNWAETLRPAIQNLSQDILDQKTRRDDLTKSLSENQAKLIASAQAMGYSSERFREFLVQSGFATSQVDLLGSMYDRLTSKVNTTNEALADQTDQLKRVRDELKGLLSIGEEEIETKILDIVKKARSSAEARKLAQEEIKGNQELRDLLQRRRTATEAEKAARDVLEPKPISKGAATRITRDKEVISAMREVITELSEDFKEAFGRALPARFGQGALHTAQGWDHRAAADISLDARTPEGKFVMEWLAQRGINARASLGREVSKTTGKIVSTGVHIHAGELSGPIGRALRMREGLLSPKGLQEQQSLAESQFAGMSLQDIAKMMRETVPAGQAALTTETSDVVQSLGKEFDLYYDKLNKKEEELGDRRKYFSDEYYSNYKNIILDIGNLELDLQHLRQQAADDQFTEQRRLLAAKTEEVQLTEKIIQAQDQLANGPLNESLRIQLALLGDINDLRRRDEEAIIAQNKAQIELADATILHGEQVRAIVMAHMAQQKSITEAWGEGIVSVYDKVGGYVDKAIEKLTHGLGIVDNILKSIAHQLLNRLFQRFLDAVFPSSATSQRAQGGGGGFGSIIRGIFGGGAGAVGPGGTPPFAGSFGGTGSMLGGGGLLTGLFGGGLTSPISATGGGLHEIGHGVGLPTTAAGGPLGGLGAQLGAMLPFIGGPLGTSLGGRSRTGSVLGGVGGILAGGIGAAFLAPGLFAASGIFGSMGPAIAGLLTNPITAVVAGALLVGALVLRRNSQRRHDEETRNQATIDTRTALFAILSAVQVDQMDGGTARSEIEKLHQQWIQVGNSLKDSKTRRIHMETWNHFQPIIDNIEKEIGKQSNRANIRARMSPVFASGGVSHQSQLIKVRPGEGFRYPGSNQVQVVAGADLGYDSRYMYAPKGTEIISVSDMKSSPGFQSGGDVGMGNTRTRALRIESIEISIDDEGIAQAVIHSPDFEDAVVQKVRVGRKKRRI